MFLALGPLAYLLVSPRVAALSDRTGRPDLSLRIASVGAMLCFSTFLLTERFSALWIAFAGYAVFSCSIPPLLDGLALQRVVVAGGSYTRMRLFGSVGFGVTAMTFGLVAQRIPHGAVTVGFAMMASYVLWSFTIQVEEAPRLTRAPALVGLLGNPQLRMTLLACAIHWMAQSPYTGFFSVHVLAMGLPTWVIGGSAAVGIVAEVTMFAYFPRLHARFQAHWLLAVALAFSSVRWLLTGLIVQPIPLILVAVLNAFSLACFAGSAAALVNESVPPEMRTSGQGLLVASTLGVGGLLGYLSAGAGYDLLGGRQLFFGAAFLDGLATVAAVSAAIAHTRARAGVRSVLAP
jgi:PPP family 3-phenylpropionic acid transporter